MVKMWRDSSGIHPLRISRPLLQEELCLKMGRSWLSYVFAYKVDFVYQTTFAWVVAMFFLVLVNLRIVYDTS